jgi:plastocyanin
MTSFRMSGAAILTAGALTACGGHSGLATSSQSEAPVHARVQISGFSYHQPTIAVRVGGRITFTNRDHTAHTATATHGAFDTGTLGRGASRTVTFSKAGVYTFYCQFHAFMRGEIVVR